MSAPHDLETGLPVWVVSQQTYDRLKEMYAKQEREHREKRVKALLAKPPGKRF